MLPDIFAADLERLARFEREAKLLAQLNHANIASIHGLEDADGVRFIAMECVEGDTLSERIAATGGLDVEEVLSIARQLAEALEAAHETGIIHRDLKPANVKVTPTGEVKALDFGLAKAYEADGSSSAISPDLSGSPTIVAATGAGVILGTAAYMSPEQARGKPLDKRTDIWSFGAVLYEMLTGRVAFTGETVSDVMAAILKQEPDWSILPSETPRALERLLRRCLEKDPRQRLRDIGEARIELEDTLTRPPVGTSLQPVTAGWQIRTALPWALALLMATATLVLFLRQQNLPQSNALVRRFAIDLPWRAAPNWTDFTVALSPHGTHFVYNGRVDNQVDLYVRAFDSLDAQPLADAREAGVFFFSPDGEWVGLLLRGGKLQKVSIHGGRAQDLTSLEDFRVEGLSWGTDGNILIGTFSGLYRVPESGGAPQRVTQPNAGDGEPAYLYPSHLPGGASALITIVSENTTQWTDRGR